MKCITLKMVKIKILNKKEKKGHPLESDSGKRKEEKVILKDQTM